MGARFSLGVGDILGLHVRAHIGRRTEPGAFKVTAKTYDCEEDFCLV